MNNNDFFQRFLFEPAPIRGVWVRLHNSFQAIASQHAYPVPIRQLLGEALSVVCLLHAMMKGKGRLTLQFNGQGNIKLLMVQCNAEFHVRGLVQYSDEFEKIEDCYDAIAEGTLAITMDTDPPGGNRYQGIVSWQKGDTLTQAIAEYFRLSEQLPTKIWLAVDQESTSGLLLQVLPSAQPESFQNDWEHVIHLTETIRPTELLHLELPILLKRLYSSEDIRIFPATSVEFRCTCSVTRSENAVRLLGQIEAEEELNHHQKLVVTCEFCNKEYIFDRVDVARIFKMGHSLGDVH